MRILVTGGAGFVGSHVAEYYAKKGEEVVVLDNLSRAQILGKGGKNATYNWEYLRKFDIELIKGDIRDFDQVRRASKEADVIIHAAAQVAVTTSVKDPKTDFELNAVGTFNVLEAARQTQKNPTVIYCSTNKVYGENVNKIPVMEEETRYAFSEDYKKGIPETFPTDLCEHTPYGCSKLTGDLYTQDYGHLYGLKTGVFRMSCIYGTRQFGVEDQGWVAWFTIANVTGKPITIYGDGKQVRDVLYVTDLVNAYDAFLKRGITQGVYNIGGGPENTLSLLELLEILRKLTGRESEISFSDWRPSDQKVYISDISKAERELGWKPLISPEAGVKNLVDWVSKNEGLF
jgi:CDP-paratose 2-epimerase